MGGQHNWPSGRGASGEHQIRTRWREGARAEGGVTWSSISPYSILQGGSRGPEMRPVPMQELGIHPHQKAPGERECGTAQTTVLCIYHRASLPPSSSDLAVTPAPALSVTMMMARAGAPRGSCYLVLHQPIKQRSLDTASARLTGEKMGPRAKLGPAPGCKAGCCQ